MRTSKINKLLARKATSWIFIWLITLLTMAACLLTSPTPEQLPVAVTSTALITSTATISSTDSAPAPDHKIDQYAVVGVTETEFLNLYQEPSLDSPIIAQIPSTGTSIKPEGQIFNADKTNWLFVEYNNQKGWVDQDFLAEQMGTLPEELISLGQFVAKSLKENHYNQLIGLIHPEICLRFSPYSFLNQDNLSFCPGDLNELITSEMSYTWGHFDGTGHPIELTFQDYHQKFIYDADYFKPLKIGYNVEVSYGNSINNIQEIYPDGMMIEYHFPGFDPQYGGLDWRSLRLVFVQENGQWYLTAIIHCEWTI